MSACKSKLTFQFLDTTNHILFFGHNAVAPAELIWNRLDTEATRVTVEADQGAQYLTGEEAPATPAEDQATVYRYM